jgi:hypothetical protein
MGRRLCPKNFLDYSKAKPMSSSCNLAKSSLGRAMPHIAYIVKSGKLQIFDENRILETVTAGGILGEMARSAMMPGAQPLAPSVNVWSFPSIRSAFCFLYSKRPFSR